MLIEKGADPCVKNHNGKSPYEVATAPAVYNFLLQSRGKCFYYLFLFSIFQEILFSRVEIKLLPNYVLGKMN